MIERRELLFVAGYALSLMLFAFGAVMFVLK